jgi:hypothetical protein
MQLMVVCSLVVRGSSLSARVKGTEHPEDDSKVGITPAS